MLKDFLLMLAGAAGAIVREILRDNSLALPKKINGKLFLGFIGSAIVGGFVGYFIDGSYFTAAMGGYVGISAFENLINKNLTISQKTEKTIQDIIIMIAKEEQVDPDLALRVAKCESNFDTKAININSDGSRDRGLFQINDKFHPEVSDEQAFDPIFSTRFFCKAFKNGHLDWWNATRNCWDLTKK